MAKKADKSNIVTNSIKTFKWSTIKKKKQTLKNRSSIHSEDSHTKVDQGKHSDRANKRNS